MEANKLNGIINIEGAVIRYEAFLQSGKICNISLYSTGLIGGAQVPSTVNIYDEVKKDAKILLQGEPQVLIVFKKGTMWEMVGEVLEMEGFIIKEDYNASTITLYGDIEEEIVISKIVEILKDETPSFIMKKINA